MMPLPRTPRFHLSCPTNSRSCLLPRRLWKFRPYQTGRLTPISQQPLDYQHNCLNCATSLASSRAHLKGIPMTDHSDARFNDAEDMSDDEALRVAIALSLGQDPFKPQTAGRSSATIDLTQDSEGDNGRSKSKITVESQPAAKDTKPSQTSKEASTTSTQRSSVSALLGLDRKKMEEERLARLKSKKRSASSALESPSPTTARPQQRPKMSSSSSSYSKTGTGPQTIADLLAPESDEDETASSQGSNSSPVTGRMVKAGKQQQATKPSESGKVAGAARATGRMEPSSTAGRTLSGNRTKPELPFPKGALKKTWVRGQARKGDDITIEEVFQKDKLQLAVLSTFILDEAWLFDKLDLTKTKLILCRGAPKHGEQISNWLDGFPTVRKHLVPMNGSGCMHSKLQLLKYEDYLRIVVPSANLVSFDWGETGDMENILFIIDLPVLDDPDITGELTPFGEELSYFLKAKQLDDGLIRSLKKYDWTETRRYGFVHSIAASHVDDKAWRTGYCGLGRTVKALGLGTAKTIEMDVVAASLGSIKDSLLKALYYACQGDSGVKELESRPVGKKGHEAPDIGAVEVRKHTRVYFPSKHTVRTSIAKDAGTICFQRQWFESPTFPREVLRDCVSTRPGMLMHDKMIFVRKTEESKDEPGKKVVSGFAYVGSANLSESAWGRLIKDRSTKKLKITCRNWECGVVVPAGTATTAASSSSSSTSAEEQEKGTGDGNGKGKSAALPTDTEDGQSSWGVFEGHVPIPMKVPGSPLEMNGPKSPFFFGGF
ncbi:tyrosyl-DNA phosphodiesterase-domain-containing protein [Pseudoneurospora amorphoporcata]|uniref:Tyrosyl-DNA phosphodiesterase-domain-containing protein n=1 Tax=Pseudoneurospora amorphoporcata TaxID=241081 RepID=A0AAN6NWZ2_9PEZI|nr:tyrosyl-DNA phosphodiesterase-domain-containing protein [Pseudoneurospora amorphoporcata]